MTDGERRRLVYSNLLMGHPVSTVMQALHLSEKEVLDDFAFVTMKIRSYRFERAMPMVACDTIELARANRIELLHTMGKLNLNKQATFSRVESLPLDIDPSGGMSVAEQHMLEARMRAGG